MIKLKDLIIESIDSDEVAGVVYIVNKESFLCLKRSDKEQEWSIPCLLYTSPSPRDRISSRMPSSA